MRFNFRHYKLLAGSFLIAVLSAAFGWPAVAENNEQYVMVSPGHACSLEVENIGIKSFRMLIPVARLKDITENTAILSVHVCECYLLGGDQQKCALDAITKTARQVDVAPQDTALLGGRIFILLEDSTDFAKIYTGLRSMYPPPTWNAAWRIMHDLDASALPQTGRGAEPSSLPPPPPAGPTLSPAHEQQQKKKHSCEVSSNVCIDPKTNEASAEFELNCDGLPPIVFSTDGKAGLKLGPLEISLSVGGSDKH
jgi:hypothetical protein